MDGLFQEKRELMMIFKDNSRLYVKVLFDELRDYCFSLGKNVIEDVRMHRIMFASP